MESDSTFNEATVCCVYTDKGCNTDVDWTPVAPDIAQFLGVYYEGVRSFQCSLWVGPWSQCTDGWNPSAPEVSPL